MDLLQRNDQHTLHRCRRRSRITKTPSCKISAAPTSSSLSSASSFHGSCSPQSKKKACKARPLIYHTYDPETIEVEPAEFMLVVQRLTGSSRTRSMLRAASMQRRKETDASTVRVQDGQLRQQDPLLEPGTTMILTPTSAEVSMDALQPSHSCAAATAQAISAELNSSPSSMKASGEIISNTSRNPPCSPNSSLTTSSEGYCTDSFSIEGGASPYREALSCNSTHAEAEEDGAINFFVFSRDSYYGNDDDLDLLGTNAFWPTLEDICPFRTSSLSLELL